MTADFYAVLDTMFNRLPEFEGMDHEWLYYFVTGNGGTTADFEVSDVEQTDKTHAVATLKVRQKWEDGSFDESSGVVEHKLYMEKVDGNGSSLTSTGTRPNASAISPSTRKSRPCEWPSATTW